MTTPIQLLAMILNKKALNLNTRGEHVNDYVLKVCGQEEYLVGDYPLIQFVYIQEALSRDIIPTLVAVSVDSVASKSSITFFYTSLKFSLWVVNYKYKINVEHIFVP